MGAAHLEVIEPADCSSWQIHNNVPQKCVQRNEEIWGEVRLVFEDFPMRLLNIKFICVPVYQKEILRIEPREMTFSEV